LREITSLSDLENRICRLIKSIKNFNDSFEEMEILELATMTADYSHQLNISLKEYALINFVDEKNKKIHVKANINFGYHILDLLAKIVRLFEGTNALPGEIEINFQTFYDMIDQKELLLQNIYIIDAKKELDMFHNPNIRKKLNDDLEKRLRKR